MSGGQKRSRSHDLDDAAVAFTAGNAFVRSLYFRIKSVVQPRPFIHSLFLTSKGRQAPRVDR